MAISALTEAPILRAPVAPNLEASSLESLMPPTTTDEVRAAFLGFFAERGHTLQPSSSLIPSHPAAPLFTNAGMVPFIPYFLGEEPAPFARATSSQRCVRVRGKHDDIEVIGRTTRHLTFFEMLGNFSFGDYFKAGAIGYAWSFLTEVLGIEADRLWATVHHTDDEAFDLWTSTTGMPAQRVQRLGDDNFWEMGPTGPCGPSSEVFYDKGPGFGSEGGPAHGGEERFVEVWNLVFMSFYRQPDGSLEPLPKNNIDTGAGLERLLPVVQQVSSVFDTDVLRGLIGRAEALTGARYGADPEHDVSLRILADHARAFTFLIADGVVPSNTERGYVLRRIIRRAVRHAQRVGAAEPVLAEMARAVAEAMRDSAPELPGTIEAVAEVLDREEHRFQETLSLGLRTLDELMASGVTTISGADAFRLHDTFGFPVDLTREIAADRGVEVDIDGFEQAMAEQRRQARSGGPAEGGEESARYLAVLDAHGPTEFLGYSTIDAEGTVVAVLHGPTAGQLEVFTDRTPFYAEGGGQLGDQGRILGEGGEAKVVDTTAALPGLIRHVVEGGDWLAAGQHVRLQVDGPRRDALRRSHTATHLLHWALRTTFGEGLRQQGSLVAPDQLRFDFNFHTGLSDEQIADLEDLVAAQIITDGPVRVEEMPKAEAVAAGAISFFGEKYGEVVRVVRAGDASVELCGGTHVASLGQIGTMVIRSESSVGSNLRRIEAVTGMAARQEIRRRTALLEQLAEALKVGPDEAPDALRRLQEHDRATEKARRELEARLDAAAAAELAAAAVGGVVVARRDGRDAGALRALALAVRQADGVRAVGLIGSPDGRSAALVVALADGAGDAGAVAKQIAPLIGGGGGGKDPRLATAGGRDASRIDEALAALRQALAS